MSGYFAWGLLAPLTVPHSALRSWHCAEQLASDYWLLHFAYTWLAICWICMFAFSLPSAASHGILEAAGKAAWMPDITQGWGPCGVCFWPQLSETVCVLEWRETLKNLWHIWAVLSAHPDWISKRRDRIWHFSSNTLCFHVNVLKLKTNMEGRGCVYNFPHSSAHVGKTLGL